MKAQERFSPSWFESPQQDASLFTDLRSSSPRCSQHPEAPTVNTHKLEKVDEKSEIVDPSGGNPFVQPSLTMQPAP